MASIAKAERGRAWQAVVEPASLICPSGCGVMHRIGEDRSERLGVVTAQLRAIVTLRPKYACRTCPDGVTQGEPFCAIGSRTMASAPKGGKPVHVAHCWAQARRKLKEDFDRDGSEIAAEGLRRITAFYAIEADIRGVSPGQRLSARQARKISAKSRLGETLADLHIRWGGRQEWVAKRVR